MHKDFIQGPFIFGIGFGHALQARAMWTSSRMPYLQYGAQIGRGVWAGHRFDITTRSRHDDATTGEEWRDVRDEIASDIAGIWESEFGPDWVDTQQFYQRYKRFEEEPVVEELMYPDDDLRVW